MMLLLSDSAAWSSRTSWSARAAGPKAARPPEDSAADGTDAGFISFGRVARAVAKRAAPFGYD